MTSIMECFPKRLRPRQGQIEALRLIERDWDRYDVFVLNLPVASGKSAIAQTIAKWSATRKGLRAITLAPNNLLVRQYQKDYPRLASLEGTAHYWCSTVDATIKERKKRDMGLCKSEDCKGCRNYSRDIRRIRAVPYGLCNYHVYLAHQLAATYPTVVVDEAHNLIPVLQDMASSRLWRHLFPKGYRWPETVSSVVELRAWLREVPDCAYPHEGALAKFRRALDSDKYIFRLGEEDYRDNPEQCVKLLPLYLTEEPNYFFTKKTKKIILMSATISEKDIEQLGLALRKVRYVSATSCIPAPQRPVIVTENAPSMAYRAQDENLAATAALILRLLEDFPDEKGLIHAPYSLARKLASVLRDERFLFHTKENKREVYEQFRNATEPRVLVASGMYEGIDLPYEAGRWQVITKVPFPSLAEPAIQFRAEQDASWYGWETVKCIQQAIGRICRGPDDWGITFLFDTPSFNRLYEQHPQFWPFWQREAMYDAVV